MVISILSLELSMCMCARNYEIEVIAHQVGQHTRERWIARVAVDTGTRPPRHCCVPLAGFAHCYRISQLHIVTNSCHRGTGSAVNCARWSLPLHIPSLPKAVLLVLCGKVREGQIGWTWFPPRLLGLGFCFGQAIKFYYFFFFSLKGVHWMVWICWWVGGMRSEGWTGGDSGCFSVDFSEYWVRFTVLEQRILDCTKGAHSPWRYKYRIAGLGGALNCFSPVKSESVPLTRLAQFWIKGTVTKSRISPSVSSYRAIYSRTTALLVCFPTYLSFLQSREWKVFSLLKCMLEVLRWVLPVFIIFSRNCIDRQAIRNHQHADHQ